jgi:putative methyltransferase (TIGR04325 family)
MSFRGALKELLPDAALRAFGRKEHGSIRFEGDYRDWQQALRAGAYDDAAVLNKMYEAELAVKEGRAADARDGVMFDSIQFSFPVIAGLGRIACNRGEPLRVVDFGGAFGGSYRQYKAFYGESASWAVVEQARIVHVGNEHFASGDLEFHLSLRAALAARPADVILLSSVIQYLREPYVLIGEIVHSKVKHVIIDRTPCSKLTRDVLAVQHVPPEIYAASYPCWIFSRERLLGAFSEHFHTAVSFTDGSGMWHGERTDFELTGFILDRPTREGA